MLLSGHLRTLLEADVAEDEVRHSESAFRRAFGFSSRAEAKVAKEA